MLSILSFGSRHLARTAACTVRFVPATQVFVQHFSMSVDDLRKAMDDLSDKVRWLHIQQHPTRKLLQAVQFVEARENIDDAKESEGSVYYAEDLDIAIESVQGSKLPLHRTRAQQA